MSKLIANSKYAFAGVHFAAVVPFSFANSALDAFNGYEKAYQLDNENTFKA